MTWWLVGDEEPEDERFVAVGPAGFGLYHMAGAHCMAQVRYRPEAEIPGEWHVSDRWVRGWPGGMRTANKLVEQGLFVRVNGGFAFGWIRPQNTADYVRQARKKEREKKSARRPRS